MRVTIERADQGIRISIEDNGPGFHLDEVRNRPGLGLLSMQERARIVGANLIVQTKPGRGTRITVRIPKADR